MASSPPGLRAYLGAADPPTRCQCAAGEIAAMHKTSSTFHPMLSWFDMALGFGTSFLEPASPALPHTPAMTQTHDSHSLFVPSAASRTRPPMVVMLHGAGQDPTDFAAGTAMNATAQRHGFVALYPAQRSHHNPHRCWNWFEAAHQSRSQGEPERITALALQVAKELGVDPDRIYVAGLSAGGAMAALLGELFPDVYAAVGAHSGLAARSGADLLSGLAAMRGAARAQGTPSGMPTIVFHGDTDIVVHPINGHQLMEASFGTPVANSTRERTGHEGRGYTCLEYLGADGIVMGEHWMLHDGGHAWSGGHESGSYADPLGPDASEEMLRFFELQHRRKLQPLPCVHPSGFGG